MFPNILLLFFVPGKTMVFENVVFFAPKSLMSSIDIVSNVLNDSLMSIACFSTKSWIIETAFYTLPQNQHRSLN